MAVGFKLIQSDGRVTDVDDLLVRRELFNDGSLWTWGGNTNYNNGVLGTNNATATRSIPGTTAGGGTNWKQVACGYNVMGGIKTNGTMWLWGSGNANGDAYSAATSSPTQVPGGGTNWKQLAYSQNAAAAIKTDGTLWTWGIDAFINPGGAASPVTITGGGTTWKSVATGFNFAAAIKTDGSIWTWGYNANGQLGDGTVISKLSPIMPTSGSSGWKFITAGGSVGAGIKTDGSLWAWGYGLGNTPAVLTPGNDWSSISVTNAQYAGIKTNGTLWTWGSNLYGQLGDGTGTSRTTPGTTAGGGTNWKQVSVGKAAPITAAVKTNGTLWTWGVGDVYGQLGGLGDGYFASGTGRNSPGITSGGGNNWKQVDAGTYDVVAAVKDLTV